MSRPRVLPAAAILFALSIIAGAIGGTFAAFSNTTSNGPNNFTAAADWTAPTVSASVIAKQAGGTPDFIKQGGTYYVYATVTDTGNPASGVSTVTANVSTITTGQTTAALAAGSFTIGGVTYNRQSALLTASNPLSAGSKTYSVTATDSAANTATTNGFSVTVDNTVPSATDVQTTSVGGGTLGHPELGDTITLTYSETMDPNSILAGWTGTSQSVVVRIGDLNPDVLTVWNAANSAQLPLGGVSLGRNDYVAANRTFGASGTASTMVQSGSAITVTLGTASGATGTAAANSTMAWTPSATATDRAGNACSVTARNETGGNDKDF